MEQNDERYLKVVCPKCGYKMQILFSPDAKSRGIFVVCKGRNCKSRFEIRIENGKQING